MPKLTPMNACFALALTGDLAGVTFIQNTQRRRIAYAKTWPKRNPTPAQANQRNRFNQAIQAWRALTPQQKQTLDDITNKLKMVMSGYNLYISCWLQNTLEYIESWASNLGLVW